LKKKNNGGRTMKVKKVKVIRHCAAIEPLRKDQEKRPQGECFDAKPEVIPLSWGDLLGTCEKERTIKRAMSKQAAKQKGTL
jgi:hypothetical protein